MITSTPEHGNLSMKSPISITTQMNPAYLTHVNKQFEWKLATAPVTASMNTTNYISARTLENLDYTRIKTENFQVFP